MPSKRRNVLRHRGSPRGYFELTGGQRFALTIGNPRMGGPQFSDWSAADPAPWKAAWKYHGVEILAEYIAAHPGRRPWPWWVWDHGQERPIVNPMGAEQELQAREQYTIFGVLVCGIEHGHGAAPGEMHPWLEPEEEYLERMGLLTDGERKILSATIPI
jgi:hypothetical protein